METLPVSTTGRGSILSASKPAKNPVESLAHSQTAKTSGDADGDKNDYNDRLAHRWCNDRTSGDSGDGQDRTVGNGTRYGL
jgi:hypothetical protein